MHICNIFVPTVPMRCICTTATTTGTTNNLAGYACGQQQKIRHKKARTVVASTTNGLVVLVLRQSRDICARPIVDKNSVFFYEDVDWMRCLLFIILFEYPEHSQGELKFVRL